MKAADGSITRPTVYRDASGFTSYLSLELLDSVSAVSHARKQLPSPFRFACRHREKPVDKPHSRIHRRCSRHADAAIATFLNEFAYQNATNKNSRPLSLILCITLLHGGPPVRYHLRRLAWKSFSLLLKSDHTLELGIIRPSNSS